ncbi:hypothetical protein [Mucilaginibacter sp.]
MKKLKLLLFVFICFTNYSYSQNSKAIIADLNKSLDNIDSLNKLSNTDTATMQEDSSFRGQSIFETKLKYYLQNDPASADLFLKQVGATTDDGVLTAFSWDTGMGGTEKYFENILEYKSGGKLEYAIDTVKSENEYSYAFDGLYTLKIGGESYYLIRYYGVFDLYAEGEGIRIVAIENGKLIDKARIIKTKRGLTYKLYYNYNLGQSNNPGDITLEYDPKLKTITFPIINGNGQITDNSITYKFTGQYFEKVK